jgi:hypothetical protein
MHKTAAATSASDVELFSATAAFAECGSSNRSGSDNDGGERLTPAPLRYFFKKRKRSGVDSIGLECDDDVATNACWSW